MHGGNRATQLNGIFIDTLFDANFIVDLWMMKLVVNISGRWRDVKKGCRIEKMPFNGMAFYRQLMGRFNTLMFHCLSGVSLKNQ